MEDMCSVRSVPGLYNEDLVIYSRVEVGLNNFTVALRVVGGGEKEPSAWGYSGATMFLGDISKGNWPSRLWFSNLR
jgi:hypothetical protein